jgi:uncharacterized phage protein (predicted DNA packaging)
MDIEEVKLYLRITNDVEDSLLEKMMSVAEGIIIDAVTGYDEKILNDRFKAKTEMCQMALIAELYENRNQGGREPKDYGFTIRTMITQMQYWGGG